MSIELSQRAVAAAVRFEVLEGCTVPDLPSVDPAKYQLNHAQLSPAGYAWYEVRLNRTQSAFDASLTQRAVVASLGQLSAEGVLRDLRILSGEMRRLTPHVAPAPSLYESEYAL